MKLSGSHFQIWYFFQILYCFLEILCCLNFMWWFCTVVSIDTENVDRVVLCRLVSQYSSYIICPRQATNLVLIRHQFSHAYCILSLEQQFFYCTFCNSYFLYCNILMNRALQWSKFVKTNDPTNCFLTWNGESRFSFFRVAIETKHSLIILLKWLP